MSQTAPSHRKRIRLSKERGIALMMVVISITILTVLATDMAYNARVDLQIAANARDDVRAQFLARSGIGMARLLLRFQRQVDQIQLPNLASLLGGLMPGGAPAAGTPGTPQPANLSIQLWRMAKIDCYMLQMMISDEASAKGSGFSKSKKTTRDFDEAFGELGEAQALKQFGGFEGCFNAVISDEEERLNLSKLDAPTFAAQAILMQAISTFADKKYEFLFETEDSNKVRATPNDIIGAMRDWIDEDRTQSQINPTFVGDPFQRGFSDENSLYDRYNPRYQAKNARYDSLDELYLIYGINDRFMAAFKDKVTVYPDLNSRLNINTEDPILLSVAIRSVADPMRPNPRLMDPIFIDGVIAQIRRARMFAILGMSVADFLNIVESAGVPVNPSIRNNPANQRAVGDKSTTYRIQATGESGSVTRTITTVVRLNDMLGTLVYWKEE